MKENKNFYITTPIYYPSANFHIGHCYATINTDAIARFKRLEGYDVFFQTGTDEHGLKIEKAALNANMSPKEYVDIIVEDAKKLWSSLDISYDKFLRTTDEEHVKIVQKIFKKLYDQGDIYKSNYTGKYCVPCESFWTDNQLFEGKCPDCQREVSIVSEEAYFLKLSKYQEKLTNYINDNPSFIEPQTRKNEMLNNFIKPGLEDLCITRSSFNWGIPVDFDSKHVIYVWIDALSNYITSLGYLTENDQLFNKYWPANVHIVGKEITRFHTIIWPILLMALDLPLPKQIFGHGWLIIDGAKISKSSGNYKDPREYIGAYGVDAVRYYALKEVQFGKDGTFSEEALINRTNSDLVNNLGNLVTRSVSMINKYFDSTIPFNLKEDEIDKNLLNSLNLLPNEVIKLMNNYHVSEALTLITDYLKNCNKYIDETTPWLLAKDETTLDRLGMILYNLVESIRICSILLQAFIPKTSSKILDMLNIANRDFTELKYGSISKGHVVNQSEIIYQRIEPKV